MNNTFRIEIFTPYGEYLSDSADALTIFSEGTSLGILPNHYPLISTLEISKIKLTISGEVTYYAIGEGILNVGNNSVSILVDCIERSDEIDIERCLDKKKEVEEKLLSCDDSDLRNSLKKSLKKANNRIDLFNNCNSK